MFMVILLPPVLVFFGVWYVGMCAQINIFHLFMSICSVIPSVLSLHLNLPSHSLFLLSDDLGVELSALSSAPSA